MSSSNKNAPYVDSTASSIDNTLNEGSKIYQNAFVKHCVLGRDVVVGDFTRTEDSVFDDGVKLQRYGMIYSSEIGRHSYTGRNCTIWHTKIGKYCSISWNVSAGGANHDYTRVTTHAFLYAPEFGFIQPGKETYDRFETKCEIGNDVWIGAGVSICRNVSIGNGAVIGTGAVVTKDVEPYSIVVGSPAKLLKKRFDNETIKALEEIEWWNFPDETIRQNVAIFGDKIVPSTLEKLSELKRRL